MLVGGSSQAAKLFRQMQLFLEVLNDVLEFRQIFRGRLDQGLVSFQHRLRPSGAVFFQRYWKSFASRIAQDANAGEWKAEMVWFKTVDPSE